MTVLASALPPKRKSVLILVYLVFAVLPCSAATKFVYAHSGDPAAQVMVEENTPNQDPRWLTTDEAGETPTLRPGSEVIVRDARTKIPLLKMKAGASFGDTIRVPELIRLTGSVQSDPAGRKGLIVRYGIGERVSPLERLRRNYDRYSLLKDTGTIAFGLELPKAPLYWLNATVNADGTYITTWFPALDNPMVVAHNADRAIGIRDVTLPSTFHTGEAFAVDPVQLTPTQTVFVTYKTGEHPVEVDAQLHLTSVEIAPEDRERVARLLSVLDSVDPRLFVFAAGLRAFNLEPGTSEIAGLPAFRSLHVKAGGAVALRRVERDVSFSDGTANLNLSLEELLPPGETAPFKGVVVIEGSYSPVKDAQVVYSCYPDKIETTTAEDGSFGIASACRDRDFTLFVTASDWMEPPRFAPAQVRKRVRPNAGPDPLVIVLPVGNISVGKTTPHAHAIHPPQPAGSRPPTSQAVGSRARPVTLQSSSLAPLFRGQAVPPGVLYEDDPQYDEGPIVYVYNPSYVKESVNTVLDAEWVDKFTGKIRLTALREGTYIVLLAYSAYNVYLNEAVDLQSNVPKVVSTSPIPDGAFQVLITFFTPSGFWLAPDLPIYITSPAVDPDPTEIDTNSMGVATFGVLDTRIIHVFASSEMGYYDCDVHVDSRNYATVTLLPSSSSPCPER